jgi:hypothetical protein
MEAGAASIKQPESPAAPVHAPVYAEAAALQLLGEVQGRLGRELTYGEWRMLNAAGENTAAEWSPVEAEVLVRLLERLPSSNLNVGQTDGLSYLRERLSRARFEAALPWSRPSDVWLLIVTLSSCAVLQCLMLRQLRSPLDSLLASSGWIVLLTVLLLAGRSLQRERRKAIELVSTRLSGSSVIERLVENDPALSDIQRYTPVPLNWLMLGFPQSDLMSRIRLISRHLDWYLEPPRRYARWHWYLRFSWLLIPLFLVDWAQLFTGKGLDVHLMALWLPAMLAYGLGNANQMRLEHYFSASLAAQLLGRVRQRNDLSGQDIPAAATLPA